MEDSFKNYLFGFILISLFGMLILTAVIETGETYSKDTSEIAGGSLSISSFNNSISDIEDNSKALNKRFSEGSVWSAIAGVVVEGIFGIALDMFKLILSPFNLLMNIMIDIFHIPVFVTSILLGLLIFGSIFAIWRLIKIGD